MQRILPFAIVVLVVAVLAPPLLSRRHAGNVVIAQAEPEIARARVAEAVAARTVEIVRSANGHFATDAMIDGRRLTFMIDTGATMIALREGDAAKLGIHPAQREYTQRISTANGMVFAAPITLNRVELGDLLVRNVAAVVLPDSALAQNLLGMSFLGKVHWQYAGSKLVLEQ